MTHHCTRCRFLEDRVAELEELLGLNVEPPLGLQLTRNERRMFGLLLARHTGVTMDALVACRRTHYPREPEDPQASTEVQLSTLRRKLRDEGVIVERYVGGYADVYKITTATRRKAEALVNIKGDDSNARTEPHQPEGPAAPGDREDTRAA